MIFSYNVIYLLFLPYEINVEHKAQFEKKMVSFVLGFFRSHQTTVYNSVTLIGSIQLNSFRF